MSKKLVLRVKHDQGTRLKGHFGGCYYELRCSYGEIFISCEQGQMIFGKIPLKKLKFFNMDIKEVGKQERKGMK